MARYSGRQYKGASRDVRATKRREAEARNAFTKPERRAEYVRNALMTELAILKRADRNRARRGRRSFETTGY